MLESQLDLSTTERQLLYDMRAEIRKTNELLGQLIQSLNPVAMDIVDEPKPLVSIKTNPIKERKPTPRAKKPRKVVVKNGSTIQRDRA